MALQLRSALHRGPAPGVAPEGWAAPGLAWVRLDAGWSAARLLQRVGAAAWQQLLPAVQSWLLPLLLLLLPLQSALLLQLLLPAQAQVLLLLRMPGRVHRTWRAWLAACLVPPAGPARCQLLLMRPAALDWSAGAQDRALTPARPRAKRLWAPAVARAAPCLHTIGQGHGVSGSGDAGWCTDDTPQWHAAGSAACLAVAWRLLAWPKAPPARRPPAWRPARALPPALARRASVRTRQSASPAAAVVCACTLALALESRLAASQVAAHTCWGALMPGPCQEQGRDRACNAPQVEWAETSQYRGRTPLPRQKRLKHIQEAGARCGEQCHLSRRLGSLQSS